MTVPPGVGGNRRPFGGDGHGGGGRYSKTPLGFALQHVLYSCAPYGTSKSALSTPPPPAPAFPVVTDGRSSSSTSTLREADALKANGVTVIAIGVGGNAAVNELEGMASEPKGEHWTDLAQFDKLEALAKALSGSCGVGIPSGTGFRLDESPLPSPSPPGMRGSVGVVLGQCHGELDGP